MLLTGFYLRVLAALFYAVIFTGILNPVLFYCPKTCAIFLYALYKGLFITFCHPVPRTSVL